jgi:hypothetical protein
MKRVLLLVVTLGVMAVGQTAMADHWHRGHRHHHYYRHHDCYPPVQAYYRPYCGPPVVYRDYYPGNSFYYYGRNFGVGFGW